MGNNSSLPVPAPAPAAFSLAVAKAIAVAVDVVAVIHFAAGTLGGQGQALSSEPGVQYSWLPRSRRKMRRAFGGLHLVRSDTKSCQAR